MLYITDLLVIDNDDDDDVTDFLLFILFTYIVRAPCRFYSDLDPSLVASFSVSFNSFQIF